VIKPSRRAIFRSVFARAGFELTLDMANDILMRVNQSLDPIPVTERMWSAYLAMRAPLRYSDLEPGHASSGSLDGELEAAVADANTRDLPRHVAVDLMLLLRLEVLLRMAGASDRKADASLDARRQAITEALEREVRAYVSRSGVSVEAADQVVEDVMGALARVMRQPPGASAGSQIEPGSTGSS
jgi:hypothetical protein